MTDNTPPYLLLQKIDRSRNMARFYALSVQPTLFGDGSLVRNWGRIGTCGRAMIELFDDIVEADTTMGRLAKTKCNRGYIRQGTPTPKATVSRHRRTTAPRSKR
jgi:predicted DNA-binding WGR domain protein